ncbi:apolipoprotein N-acyltransferase [Aquihabitans sp. G128]|uniref:apolipoprotein N-acyltransferase n=1 Tax=Aquihabitans sp. G128 TaxID=2849779 RepID=UPI001C22B97C|nr:apolipoprotein N-acyltransferase [Aquihabitans sp. G128]QXC63390.1 apolipoprotein N-acyltransferase [Aquihabitans sp. G128]
MTGTSTTDAADEVAGQATPTAARSGPVAAVLAFVRRPLVRGLAVGILLAGSLPPWGFWPLAFVALALLDRLLADAPWRSRLARGTVVGLALFAPTIVWITQLTAPGYVVAVAVFSAITGLFCSLVPPGAGRRPGLIGAWALCESLRMAWPFGGAPLSLLAVGQVAGPLAGIARIGGVLGIAIATVAIGVAVSAAASRQLLPSVGAVVGAAALLVVAVLAPHGHETGKQLDIAFVQGGGAQGTRAINSDSHVVFERHLHASAKVPAGMDLVLWPENVVDTEFDVQDSEEGRELQTLARRLQAPLLVGTVEGVSDTRFRNSQQVLDSNGIWGDRYVKVQRVPFGEWVPFRSFIEHFAPNTLARRDATISHQSGLLHTQAGPVATVISWEVFFGHRARSAVAAGGQLLYNPTNGSTYTGTFVQTQQVASSRLRAIETGRWEVQVAPTGFSAFVSPEGRVHQRTGTSEQAVRVRRGVPLRTGTTWYVRWGDLPARILAAVLLATGWALDRLRRRPARSTHAEPATATVPEPA